MNYRIPSVTALSLLTTMATSCGDSTKVEGTDTGIENSDTEDPIVGIWSVSSLSGNCYEMAWDNGDTLEFCYDYPQFAFAVIESTDGDLVVSDETGAIEFAMTETYFGEEPSTSIDVMTIVEVNIEVVEAGSEYIITGDITEINDDGESVFKGDYLVLDCLLTEAEELDCDLDEGGAADEEDLFPAFSLVFTR